VRVPTWWLATLLALALARSAAAQSAPRGAGPDWDALQREAVALLSEYIRITTTNPPGNELAGARFLKGVLDRGRQRQLSALVRPTARGNPEGRHHRGHVAARHRLVCATDHPRWTARR